MPKPEWGVKRMCGNCGTRFYDLLRDPIVCPACATVFDVADVSKPRRVRASKATAAVLVEEEEVEDEDEDTLLDDAVPEEEEDEAEDEAVPVAKRTKAPVTGEPDEVVVVEDEEDELGEFEDDVLLEDDEDEIEDLGDVPGKPGGEP